MLHPLWLAEAFGVPVAALPEIRPSSAVFGETVALYDDFWHGSLFGRLTLQDWLGQPVG